MPRNVSRLVLVLLCACALVCAAEPAGVWLNVPFVKQERNGWRIQQGEPLGAESDAAEIQRSLYSPQAHGIYASEMEHYLQQHRFRTFAFLGTPADLQQHLEKGRPLIVSLKPERGAPLHYVVVAGIDPAHNLVLLNDPAERKLLKQDLPGFEKEWKSAGHWTLLAVPQSEGASSAR
jgi:hypothetical protein